MHCLRCGAKTKENRSFCDGCSELVREPLEESPYLSMKVILPPPRSAVAIKRPEPKKERKKRPLGWIFTAFLLTVICLCLLLQGGWYFSRWLENEGELGRVTAQAQALEAEKDALSDRLSEAEKEKAELEALLEELRMALADTQSELVDVQQKILYLSQTIVFVNDAEDEMFHRVGCVRFHSRDFLAYIKEDAESKGYIPCELCLP